MSRYEDLDAAQKKVLEGSDYYNITDEETGEQVRGLGQPGCLKLAAELDYSHRVKEERCTERDGGYVAFDFIVEILDPAGRVLAEDAGSCDSVEKPAARRHNIRALAKTRAWQRALKCAAMVLDRLASDLGPTEKLASGGAQAAPQQDSPPPEPSGPECACDIKEMPEPRKHGDVHVCGKCGHPVPRTKRIQFLSAHAAAS